MHTIGFVALFVTISVNVIDNDVLQKKNPIIFNVVVHSDAQCTLHLYTFPNEYRKRVRTYLVFSIWKTEPVQK